MRTITLHLPDDTRWLDDIGPGPVRIDDSGLASLVALAVLRCMRSLQERETNVSGLMVIADDVATKAYAKGTKATRSEKRQASAAAESIIRDAHRPMGDTPDEDKPGEQ